MQASARLPASLFFDKKRPLCSDYTIHNQKLNKKTEAKYLGVTISSDYPGAGMQTMLRRRHSTMGFLKRNLRPAPQATKDTAYKTFVHPIVEYAATTWAPSTDTITNKIEMVKRRAARFVTNDYSRKSSVTDMVADLGWDTLQKHRDLARLSMMYRIIHNLVDILVEPYRTPSTSMTRGHDSHFHQIWTTNNTYQQSFFPRTIVLWNQPPQTAVSQTTLEAFQSQLAIHT